MKASDLAGRHASIGSQQDRTKAKQAHGGGYDVAQRNNWDARWTPRDESPDVELGKDLRHLRERCIDLVRNDPLAYGVIDTIAHGVVGRGPRPKACCADVAIAATLEELWCDWAPTAGWDGVTSWADVCRGAVHASCLSGDVLVLWPDVGDGTGPRVDLVDARRIDSPTDATPEVASSRLGVGYDKYGRVMGYYVASGEQAATGSREGFRFFPLNKSGRINARLFKRPSVMRPRQSRAIPMFAPAALDMKDLREYRRTEVRRAQMASKINTIISTPDPKALADAYENITMDPQQDGSGLAELMGRSYGTTPDGSMMVLGMGESAQIVTPPQVNGGVGDYMESMLRAVAACTGLPFEEAFKLYAKLNYSNARTIRMMSKSAYRDWRDDIEKALCNPTWTVFVQYAWATGALGSVAWNPEWIDIEWHWDEAEYVDPGKEISANAEAMATGQRSIVDICRTQGRDPLQVLRENLEIEKAEQEMREEMGLPSKAQLAMKPGTVTPGMEPAPQSEEPPDSEDPAKDGKASNGD